MEIYTQETKNGLPSKFVLQIDKREACTLVEICEAAHAANKRKSTFREINYHAEELSGAEIARITGGVKGRLITIEDRVLAFMRGRKNYSCSLPMFYREFSLNKKTEVRKIIDKHMNAVKGGYSLKKEFRRRNSDEAQKIFSEYEKWK